MSHRHPLPHGPFSVRQQRITDGICERVLNRLFPGATRTGDGWHDFLTATHRTEDNREGHWRWDSTVRDSYGD